MSAPVVSCENICQVQAVHPPRLSTGCSRSSRAACIARRTDVEGLSGPTRKISLNSRRSQALRVTAQGLPRSTNVASHCQHTRGKSRNSTKLFSADPETVEKTETAPVEVVQEDEAQENGLLVPGLVGAGLVSLIAARFFLGDAITGGAADGAGTDLYGGFLSAFLLIFFSEIGDKTFFLAVLLALRKPKTAVFLGTFGALGVMSFISVALGEVLHKLDELSPIQTDLPLDDYAAIALLVYFGITTIREASIPKQEEEKQEAEEEVEGMDLAEKTTSALILSTFVLVFAAEWGDKSFLATIALAAASSPVGVVSGAIAGHGAATAIAVLGGSLLGDYVSEKAAGYIGGSLFLVFAASTLVSTFIE